MGKDYIAFAELIRKSGAYLPEAGRQELIGRFCTLLADDNTRFSATRFRSACDWIETTPRSAPRLDPSPSTLEGARFYTGSDIR